MRSRPLGRRYVAGFVMFFAVLFFVVGTLGPARHSPYYLAIVPPPAAIALILGLLAWSDERRSTAYSTAGLILLALVLGLSHLLPRSHP